MRKYIVIHVEQPSQENQCLNTDNWPSCKARVDVCKVCMEMLDESNPEDIYSLGKTKLKQ